MWWVNYMVWTSKISQVNSFHRNRNHKNSKEARHQPHLLSWNKWFRPLGAFYWCGIAHHKSKGRKSRLRWYQDVDPASHAVFGKLAKASNSKGCESIGRNRIDEAIPDSHTLSTPGQSFLPISLVSGWKIAPSSPINSIIPSIEDDLPLERTMWMNPHCPPRWLLPVVPLRES